MARHVTSFRQKQIKLEIMALKKSLRQINNRIYAGENLDLDHLLLQDRISQIKDRNFFLREPEQEHDWIVSEGKPVSSFLNLEQNKSTQGIQSLSVAGVTTSDVSVVLPAIKDFYESLYSNHDTEAQQEIDNFLNEIPSLPHILSDTSVLLQPISLKEIEKAIAALCPGKSLGSDGLTAEFYKHFEERISSILHSVFQEVWKVGTLSDSQRLAVIILLFKKGDPLYLNNYRPISLTNVDYKVLAYVLSHRMQTFLSEIISVNQTAYMPGHFINTNIHNVQDTMNFFANKRPDALILFLDFKKAFDSVSHQFLMTLLMQMGFPQECDLGSNHVYWG